MQTAKTILSQLGGTGRLSAMINAKQFLALDAGVQFKFSGCKKANCIRIELSPLDLYDVTFYKIGRGGLDVKEVEQLAGLYADQLKGYIEKFTGLYLSL